MDIGKEERTIIVTPIESPIPAKTPIRREEPMPQRAPARTPSEPGRRRTPIKVPGR